MQSQNCMSCPKHVTEAMQELMSFLTSLLSAQRRRKLQPSVCSIPSAHTQCLHGVPGTHRVHGGRKFVLLKSKKSFFKARCSPFCTSARFTALYFFIPFLLCLIWKFQIAIPGYHVAHDTVSEEKRRVILFDLSPTRLTIKPKVSPVGGKLFDCVMI